MGTSNTSDATTTLTGNPAGAELLVKNTNGGSANAFGLYGLLPATSPTANAAAVRGVNSATNAYGFGVYGSQAGSGTGVRGFAPSGKGMWGTSTSGIGVLGQRTATSGTAPAVEGVTSSTDPTAAGVYGYSGSSARGVSGTGDTGVYGSGGTFGVYGSSGLYGVFGTGDTAVSGSGGSYGVSGSGALFGVFGDGDTGVYGNGGTYGVYGVGGTDAGYFLGDVAITGALTVGSCTGCVGPSALRIDDPLDPAHKYLQHSSVASAQQLDVYSGNVTTDAKGFATVRMPRWFQALNRSFRYQLTVVGKAHWDAKAAVWNEIARNRFTIRTDQPEVKVSWLVTAIRHDRYASAHPVQIVAAKAKKDQGKYVHPEVYGKPRSDGIGYRKPPQLPRKPLVKR